MVGFLISKRGQLPFKNWEANKNITNIEQNHKITQKQQNKQNTNKQAPKHNPTPPSEDAVSGNISGLWTREQEPLQKIDFMIAVFPRFLSPQMAGKELEWREFRSRAWLPYLPRPSSLVAFLRGVTALGGAVLGLVPLPLSLFLSVCVCLYTYTLIMHIQTCTHVCKHAHTHTQRRGDR